MTSRVLGGWLPLLAVSALACGGSERTAPIEWTGSRRAVDGVEIVWNQAPLAPDGRISLQRLWTIPTRPVEPNDTTWEAPSQIRAGERLVYVLDPPAGRVLTLDWNGRLTGRMGRRGEGPGELLRPFELLLAEPALGVVDRGAVRWFDSLGTPTGTARLSLGMVLRAWPLDGGRALFSSPMGWSVGVPGDSLRLLVPPFPPSHLAPDWTTIAGGSCGRVVPGPGGTILRLRCTTLVVQVLDTTGAARQEIGVTDQPEIATDEEIADAEVAMRARSIRQGMPAPMAAQSAAFGAPRLREKPRYRDIRADESWLVVWEQAPVEFGDGDAVIHVFTTDGIYLGRVNLAEQWLDFDLRDGLIVALGREADTGLAYATAYRIVVDPEVLAVASSASHRRMP